MGGFLIFSSSIGTTKRDEDVMASSAMVQSLLVSTENKTIIQTTTLDLNLKKR
jgi:hypothetical protein